MQTEGRVAPAASDKGRFVLVDSMRALAALSVLVYHVSTRYPVSHSTVWQYLSQHNAGPPITGVVLFFLISGFVLYRPFVAARFAGDPLPPLVPYAVRRIARIVPAYWVALAIVTAWLGLHEVTTATGLIRYFGFLQLYGNLKTVTGGISPAWTLCVEVTFYVTLPLMAIAVRRAPRRWSRVSPELVLCGGLVALSLVWQAIICTRMPANSTWKLPLLWMLPGSLDLFAAGMALAVLSVAMQRREQAPGWLQIVQRQPWLPWLLAGAVFYVMGRTPSLSKHSFTAWWMTSHELKALGCGLLLAPLVIGDQGRGWLRRLLAWRPLIWLGSISYGIYLWHKPLLEKLAPHLLHHGQLFTDVALTAVTVAAAAASFYLVEQPAQRFARRLIAGRSVPVAPVLVGPVVASVPEDSAA